MLKIKKPHWVKENDNHSSPAILYGINVKFADHVATVTENTDNFFIVDWRNKGSSSDYAVRYIVDKNKGTFIVYGDLGNYVANWYSKLDPAELASYLTSINYYIGKISDGEIFLQDNSLAEKEFMQIKDEILCDCGDNIEIIDEIEDDFERMIDLYNDMPFSSELTELYHKYYDYDTNPYELGKYINPRIYLNAYGYMLACEQLGMIEICED